MSEAVKCYIILTEQFLSLLLVTAVFALIYIKNMLREYIRQNPSRIEPGSADIELEGQHTNYGPITTLPSQRTRDAANADSDLAVCSLPLQAYYIYF